MEILARTEDLRAGDHVPYRDSAEACLDYRTPRSMWTGDKNLSVHANVNVLALCERLLM